MEQHQPVEVEQPTTDAETYIRAVQASAAHFPDNATSGRYRCFKCGQGWPCESALWASHVIQRTAKGATNG